VLALNLTDVVCLLWGAQIFQLFNAYTLFLMRETRLSTEWQVDALAAIFMLLACGNLITLVRTLASKRRSKTD
jgi:uncharacterized lipoprotein NlpE involved in copper resistance